MGVNEFCRYLQEKGLFPVVDNEGRWVYVYSYLNYYRRPVGKIKTRKVSNLSDPDEFVVSCTLKAIWDERI